MNGNVIASLRTDSALHEVVKDEDGQHYAVTTFFDPETVRLRLTPEQARERIQTYRKCQPSSISDRDGAGVRERV